MTERRYDPTTGEWVVFATDRQDRTHLPPAGECPLCPTRPGGPVTEIPRTAFDIAVFDNRFPALRPDPPEPAILGTGLTPVAPAEGRCEVIVYTDDHGATLATVGRERVRLLVDVWAARTADLGADEPVRYVMPFENKGAVVGVTLSHPHGQVYGYPFIPPRPLRELTTARDHLRRTGRCVWCQVVEQEEAAGERAVVGGRHFLAAVPFWARWPFQVEIWPRRHVPDVAALHQDERSDLAAVLATVLAAYDGLFGFSLPYVMAVHQRPTDGGDWDDVSHLHVEIDPPHRSADKLKYAAGSELTAGVFLTDVAPEEAAARLRAAVATAVVPP